MSHDLWCDPALLFSLQNSETFSLVTSPSGKPEEGRGRCPYDPYQRNSAITVGKR